MHIVAVSTHLEIEHRAERVPHPMAGKLTLGQIVAGANPTPSTSEKPPYLQTRALLEALRELGFGAFLWNALAQDTNTGQLLVVAGVEMDGQVLDWMGKDPRQGITTYPGFSRYVLVEVDTADRIPQKRGQARKSHPEVFRAVRSYLDQAWLLDETRQGSCMAGTGRL